MTTRDITSGLVTPIVIITATLSYAAMIFSGPLAPKLPLGIGYGLVSAGIMAIVFACAETGLLVWNDPTLLHACR